MPEPVIADKKPAVLELKAGAYVWCTCGRSQKQPFCDGAHRHTKFSPLKFTLTEDKTVSLCQCKHTSEPPYCDGTHTKLKE